MTTTTIGQELLTADDLLSLSGKGVKGELVKGVLQETMSVGGEHGEIAGALIAMWHRCGVAMVWAVYPATRTIAAHPLGGAALILGDDDALDGGAAIPGFQCAVRDILDP